MVFFFFQISLIFSPPTCQFNGGFGVAFVKDIPAMCAGEQLIVFNIILFNYNFRLSIFVPHVSEMMNLTFLKNDVCLHK